MKNIKNFICCVLLFPFVVNSETITTYDSRLGLLPIASVYNAVDIGITDKIKNPDFNILFRSYPVPSLIDTKLMVGVAITGTVAQAEVQLAARIAEQYPATAKLKGKDRRQEAKSVSDNADNANSVPALRAEVARLAELVESLLEDQQK